MALPDVERKIALGNKHVDEHAKVALEWHPNPGEIAMRDLGYEMDRVNAAIRVFAMVLPLFPKLKFERPPKQQRPRMLPLIRWHSWAFEDSAWRCGSCLARADPAIREGDLPLSGCPGTPRHLCKMLAKQAGLGHRLQRCETDSGGPLFFCTTCGAWTVSRCFNLLLPCKGRPQPGTGGWTALRRIERGRRPDTGARTLYGFSRHKDLAIANAGHKQALKAALRAPTPGSKLAELHGRIHAKQGSLVSSPVLPL